MNLDAEFEVLSEYMHIYVQLLPYTVECGGSRLNKCQLPTFEYYKETYFDDRYSLVMPHYKEGHTVNPDGSIWYDSCHGLGTRAAQHYLYYNIWMGCKYYVESHNP